MKEKIFGKVVASEISKIKDVGVRNIVKMNIHKVIFELLQKSIKKELKL